jgi:hypothetical protein
VAASLARCPQLLYFTYGENRVAQASISHLITNPNMYCFFCTNLNLC